MKKSAFVFGYGGRGSSFSKGLKKDDFHLYIIENSKDGCQKAKEDGYEDVIFVDITKDEELEKLAITEESYIVCVMEDEHLNVFLTLSLRALFPHSTIVAISDSIHVTQKLKMAGASKVIDLYQVSANRIHNILRKPIATKLLDSFVSDGYVISFREMLIPPNSYLDGMMVDDVNFSTQGVLLIGMIDIELSHKFIFITSGIEHKLDSGDTIVCIGYDHDLDSFEKMMKKEKAV
jgi:voltage-gated potassium channel